MSQVLHFSQTVIANGDNTSAVHLIAMRCFVRYLRKLKTVPSGDPALLEALLVQVGHSLELPLECIHLPIEALAAISKLAPEVLPNFAPKVVPRLQKLFMAHHSEASLGNDLLDLFKQWCRLEPCHETFLSQFVPYLMQIAEQYFAQT